MSRNFCFMYICIKNLLVHIAMLFSGKDNSIYMTREYFQEYSCAFDLKYYPFDTQVKYFAIIQIISIRNNK